MTRHSRWRPARSGSTWCTDDSLAQDANAAASCARDPDGNIDVLVASSQIGSAVNGLQYVCNKLVVPVTFALVNGERWSYCESKLHRL
ncbi:hypothetical protein BH09MYX1_BH09MYX1_03880 [soil metagenome]